MSAVETRLRRENRQLKSTLLELRSRQDRHAVLHEHFPELAGFLNALSWLTVDAEPLTAAPENPTRHTATPPLPGQSTYKARQRVKRYRLRLTDWTELMENELNPEFRPVKEVRPRCGKRGCSGRGRRLPAGSTHCAFCGEALNR